MSSVTFPAVGGGATYTDDANPSTGLDGGGHITRFIPCLKAVVDTAADVVAKQALVAADKATVQSITADISAVAGNVSGTLTAQQCKSTIIDNVSQAGAVDLQLPTAAAGMNFMLCVGTTIASAWRIRAGASDKIYLNGIAGSDNGYVGIASPTVGAYLSVFAFKTGASTYDWMAVVGNGNWAVI